MASEGGPGPEPADGSSTVPTTETTTTAEAAESVFKICGATFEFNEAILPSEETLLEVYRPFEERRLDGPDGDVVLEMGGMRLKAHKELLMARIPFFACLFSHGFREQSSEVVAISTEFFPFDPACIRSLIGCSYHGELRLTEVNVVHMLSAAIYLQMETIVDECANFLLRRVRCDSALALLARVQSIGCPQLLGRLWRYIDVNVVSISQSKAFAELSDDEVILILQRNSLRIDSEQQVFEAVNRWIEKDSKRWKDGARLLESCRLATLPDSAIELIRSKEWVKNGPDCLRFLTQHKNMARDDRICDAAMNIICVLDRSRPKWDPSQMDVPVGLLRTFNPMTLEITEARTSWVPPNYLQAAVVGHMVYFLEDSGNSARVLDSRTNEWSDFPAMPNVRSGAALHVIDGVIYVAGGHFGLDDNYTASMIALDTRQPNPEWVELAPMAVPRHWAASCTFNGRLYVFGGGTSMSRSPTDPDTLSALAELYDPSTNKWSPIAPLTSPIACASAVAFKSRIYLGASGNLIEEYDPAKDTWTRRTKPVASINSFPVLFVTGGRLMAFAREDNCVEVYDDATDEWKIYVVPADYMKDEDDCMFCMPVPAATPLPIAAIEDHWKTFDAQCKKSDDLRQ